MQNHINLTPLVGKQMGKKQRPLFPKKICSNPDEGVRKLIEIDTSGNSNHKAQVSEAKSNPTNPQNKVDFQAVAQHPQSRMYDNTIQYPVKKTGIPKSFLKRQGYLKSLKTQGDSGSKMEIHVQTNNPVTQQRPQYSPSEVYAETPAHDVYDSGSKMEIHVQTNNPVIQQRPQYSPSEVYAETPAHEVYDMDDETESLDPYESGSKRLSAFKRLGPLIQPKKPKLTINICLNKDQSVREVVGEKENLWTPVYERSDVINSTDETVVKFLPLWPWKKYAHLLTLVTGKNPKSTTPKDKDLLQQNYNRDSTYFMVSIKSIPPNWTKEMVLDLLLDQLKWKSFIPTFIEFTQGECKFLVLRCPHALLAIRDLGCLIHGEEVQMQIAIDQTLLTLTHLQFIPRSILRNRLTMVYEGETKLDLSEFTVKKDISHFIYFPLNRVYNQRELIQLHCDVIWELITELNLSHNRLTTIEGLNLSRLTPKLKILDLSHNCLERVKVLMGCRELALRKLRLEGNPLCTDYTDPKYYVRVLKTMFPTLRELDGIEITLKGDMPKPFKNYCPEEAIPVVEKFLETFFPLLDSNEEERRSIREMYSDDAMLTLTYRNQLRYEAGHKYFRSLLFRSSRLNEDEVETISGPVNIARLIKKWPLLQHDSYTFTVDVMLHNENYTLLKVCGIVKVTSETLAKDEPILAFARTVLLHNENGIEYKIKNEMIYWDAAEKEYADSAFRLPLIPMRITDLKFELPPDDSLKEKLLKMFMELTELDVEPSRRCLEKKEWHFKNALEFYIKLLKLDATEMIMSPDNVTKPM